MFKIGKIYKRKEDIHEVYGGQRQGGVSTPSSKPFVFLFTSEAGESYGYADQFRPDGIFWYTGEGQIGDMKMAKGNLAIKKHESDGKTVHLFEYVKTAYVRYLGEATYTGHHIEQRPDRDGNNRNAIIFHLAIDVDKDDKGILEELNEKELLKKLKEKSLIELRQAALQKTGNRSRKKEIRIITTIRSEAIKLYALGRAGGKCEGCEMDAPFMARQGPYLEVHHVYRLGDGGPDHPENVIAICPNCHRRVHYGLDGKEYNELFINKLRIIESKNT